MKFKYILVLFIIFIFPMSVEADRIYNLDMDVYLDENGNAEITEKWDVKASSGTEWYKQYMNLENTSVSDLYVYMDDKPLVKKEFWNVDGSLEEKSGYYGINNVNSGIYDGIELCFGKGDMNRHTFVLKYKLNNFIYNTSDSQIIYFTMFPKVKADNFEVNVTSYYSFSNNLDVWGYGYKGYAYVKNGKIIMANKGKLRNEYVVLLAKFPLDTFNTYNSYYKYSDFNTVLSMAEEGSYSHGYKDSYNGFQWFFLVFLILVAQYLIFYSVGFSISMIGSRIKKIFSGKKKHSYYRGDKKIKYDNVPFFREIPCGKNIYYANTLIYLNGLDYDNGNIVGAIILKWAKEGKIRFIKNDNQEFSKKNGSIQFFENISFDNNLEETLYKLMQTASKDNLLEAKELKKYCKNNYSLFTNLLDSFNNDMIRQLQKNMYITAPKYNDIYGMNDKIYEDSIQLIGLKKYLKEFSKIDTKEVMDIKLWDEYLMFAYLFGIADKVAKQLTNLYPTEMNNFNFDYNVAEFIFDITVDSFNAMDITADVVKAHEAGVKSYTSGGGGFSSGGGGGGSIGGGGSMGGR